MSSKSTAFPILKNNSFLSIKTMADSVTGVSGGPIAPCNVYYRSVHPNNTDALIKAAASHEDLDALFTLVKWKYEEEST